MQQSACPRILIVADDLTGAMDAAVPFAENGIKVLVSPHLNSAPTSFSDVDVLSISTETRHLPPAEAVGRLTGISAWLLSLEAEVLIKKIDSTLRGNVVAESKVLIELFNKKLVVVCPAVPAQNRIVVDGELFVGGVPLRETPFARDIRSPAPAQPLRKLFQDHFPAWKTIGVSLATTKTEAVPSTYPIIKIGDARQDVDLLRLVEENMPQLQNSLFVGASGLTRALAQVLCHQAPAPVSKVSVKGGNILFVVGSLARETDEQVKTLCRTRAVKLFDSADEALFDQSHFKKLFQQDETNIIVLKTPDHNLLSTSSAAESILDALSESVEKIIGSIKVSVIVATGGDTAQAILAKLDVKNLFVLGEISPGVVFAMIDSPANNFYIVTKAGGFGEPELFMNIIDYFSD